MSEMGKKTYWQDYLTIVNQMVIQCCANCTKMSTAEMVNIHVISVLQSTGGIFSIQLFKILALEPWFVASRII